MSRARDLANLGDGIDATQITSGVFVNERIQSSNVTQYEGNIDALASNPTVTLGSNATFPVEVTDKTQWYRGFSANGTSAQQGPYAASNNLDNDGCFISGTAPDGFDACISIEAWFVSAGVNPGNTTVTYEWNIATDGQDRNVHSKTVSGVVVSSSFGASKIRKCDLKNAANDGNDFEDLIQEYDVWGIKLTGNNTTASFRLLGIKITWRYG